MQRAGVDFAILGPSENCTGDPARRSGNEYIFQMLAMQNVETLNGMGVKKIITQCPHCFNTLMNEYPQLGGKYEVVHHSQFLEWLIDQGKLDLVDARLEERVVYHDSCYLGRHNDVYLAPRNVIGRLGGIEVVEAERNGTKGMCCGAGGARMWMEETTGTKVNDARSEELIATGASRIATACPFCYIMIDDGVKGAGKEEDEVRVADISMHLLEAIETRRGRDARPASSRPSRTDRRLSRHPTAPTNFVWRWSNTGPPTQHMRLGCYSTRPVVPLTRRSSRLTTASSISRHFSRRGTICSCTLWRNAGT